MKCVIDGTVDEKYLTLGVWGKPVIWYPITVAIRSKCFDYVCVVTESEYVKYIVKEFFRNEILLISAFPNEGLLIDGRAANITEVSIINAVNNLNVEDSLVNIFVHCKDSEEIVLIDSSNNFELSLVLCKKRSRPQWLRKMVLDRIAEKETVFSNHFDGEEICLLGHSQFDQWQIESLAGKKVKNCGISGITIREYIEDILKADKMKGNSKITLVLIGINDIVTSKTVDEIVEDILELLNLINKTSLTTIYFLEIIHTNGRLDLDNTTVNLINEMVHKRLPAFAKWIPSGKMNDPYGNLNYRYTTDGLHLNGLGYDALKIIIEQGIGR